ncbi:tetratricopeptide repeat protein [Paraburkholderia sp. ZP32-5]|uniref:tetratricopeptide repeat protein n=1 Tax=Paraburkholderia sp. ZP32-5 TaxID=2883245 RepID=UPI002DD42771|nr:tetratricopeptide repeat protein [Paraburkholderia sp. ZP32-5]
MSPQQRQAAPFLGSPMIGQNPVQAAVGDALRRARMLLDKDDLAQARPLYEGVLAIAPHNVEAMHLLGLVYLRAGDAARAEPLIARSIQAGWRQPWNLVNYGAALTGVGRHEEALTVIQEALCVDLGHGSAHAVGHSVRGDALLALARFEEAVASYDTALRQASGIGSAWRGRGVALVRLDLPADALICLENALRIDPNDALAHTERGHALRALKRYEEALYCYQLAMVVLGRTRDLLLATGTILTDMGRAVEGLARLDEGLAVAPNDEALLYASCVALDLLHDRDELLRRSDRLLAHYPDNVAAWMGRGNALLGLARNAEAAQAYGEALKREPAWIDALRNRAAALRAVGELAEALDHYDRALALTGADPTLLYNRAITYQLLGRYDEALTDHQAAAIAPASSPEQLYARGTARQQTGAHEAALGDFELALTDDPNHGVARRSEAYCRLLLGDFDKGWRQHESRWVAGDAMLTRRYVDRPLWLGAESIAGKTLLLHAEQGYGDTLQFCRYASLAHARGATVILHVPPALATLVRSVPGVDRVLPDTEAPPRFDLHCPLLSLPLAFGTMLDTVPADVPYMSADPALCEQWASRVDALAGPGRLRVGLAWSGNPRHNNDENRSLPFAMLAPLLALDVAFVSLQPQVRERDMEALAASGALRFEDALSDFAQTAALIAALDVVITVDTSVAHLAGALGKSVWVLLPTVPDWRWLIGREDSPWYPSARLFRQHRPGDWPSVIACVRDALQHAANEPRIR